MVTTETNVLAVVNDKKLYCVINLNMTDIFNKLINLEDVKDQQITDIDIQIVTDDKFTDDLKTYVPENETAFDVQCSFSLSETTYMQVLVPYLKERKEKEKKKYQETKTETRQKVPGLRMSETSKGTVIENETFVVSKAAQIALARIKNKYYNNRAIEQWTANQFHQYIHEKYKSEYGYTSLEFGTVLGKRYEKTATGVLWTQIKHRLIDVFKQNGLGNGELKEYIDWAYDKKSADITFPITLHMLCSKAMMTEWIHYLKTGKI